MKIIKVISQLLNSIKKTKSKKSISENNKIGLTVGFGVNSREVTEEEFSEIKNERKRLAQEWSDLGKDGRLEKIVQISRAKAIEEKNRRFNLGIKKYKWIWVDAGHECEVCKKRNGKIFKLSGKKDEIYPGEGYCCPDGHCKCLAKSIIPGFED
jgi:hypothetical protein